MWITAALKTGIHMNYNFFFFSLFWWNPVNFMLGYDKWCRPMRRQWVWRQRCNQCLVLAACRGPCCCGLWEDKRSFYSCVRVSSQTLEAGTGKQHSEPVFNTHSLEIRVVQVKLWKVKELTTDSQSPWSRHATIITPVSLPSTVWVYQ